jgi:hypothetical protein
MKKIMFTIFLSISIIPVFGNITTLPYTQNFEGMVFPPSEWTCYNVDGQMPQWSSNTTFNHSQGGSRSVMHLTGGAMPQEEGWLVSPPIVLPSPGGYAMTFWSYNANPELYSNLANSVLISTTTPNPATGNYSCIWSPITVTDRWHPNQVDLSPFQGNTIYIAFRYQGHNIHSWYLDDVTIEQNPSIHEFPWTENFESGVFPPYYWWQYDEDGTGEFWQTSWDQNHSDNGAISAVHFTGAGEVGWLITPQIHLPATGNYSVSFWSYNEYCHGNGTNRIMLSTQSNMPIDGDYQEIWSSQLLMEGNWVHEIVDLSDWAGESVFLAFLYESDIAHNWYLDDVKIADSNSYDTIPPIVSHLPLINTLRNDIPYPVYAEAQDDPIWNSGILSVWLIYQVNGGDWMLAQMLPERDGYQTFIPAQQCGSQISYAIAAIDDSPQQNYQYSDIYTFTVDEPVSLYYDSLSHNAWAGWNMNSWSLGVLFENPLWESSDSLKINWVSSAFRLDDAVHLKIYATDDANLNSLTPLMDPMEINITAAQWIETTVSDLYVNSQYFYVVFDDIDSNNGYAADTQRYYPDRCFMDLGEGIYQDLGDLGFNGVWMMRVEVQSADFLASPVVSILNGSEGLFLRWTEVPGADYYHIYGSDNPYFSEPWGLFDTTVALELGALGDAPYNFFKVTAVREERNHTSDYSFMNGHDLNRSKITKVNNQVKTLFIQKK